MQLPTSFLPSMFPAILLSLVVLFIYHRSRSRRPPPGTNLPPGPTRLPIVGNLFNIPHERSWLIYTDWATTFGNVIYLEVFGSPLIVLNSVKASTELFEKRSANYADRPPMVSLFFAFLYPSSELFCLDHGQRTYGLGVGIWPTCGTLTGGGVYHRSIPEKRIRYFQASSKNVSPALPATGCSCLPGNSNWCHWHSPSPTT